MFLSNSIRSIHKSIFSSVVVVFSVSSCAVFNTDIDRKMGASSAQQVATQMGLYQQAQTAAYVEAVGQRLVNELQDPEFEFQFKIVDDATPNAFALPGGYIYISRGLLALMVTEDELACVLAHEIIHVTERHSIKQMRSGILPGLIELPGNIIGGVVNENLGNIINAPISAGNDLLLSGYSRSHESESDNKGIELAAKAGYQPQQMSNILTRLNAAVELQTQQKQKKSYFDSHPFTPDRVENVNQQVTKLSIQPRAAIDPQFPMILDGLTYGVNPALGIFQEQTFLHPEMQFAIDFPAQWDLYNQPQAVLAVNEKQRAFVALSLVPNENDALANAQTFQQLVKKQTGTELDYQELPLTWGETAYLIAFADNRQKTASTIQLLWLDVNGNTYQVSAMGPDTLKESIELSQRSLRPISQAQLNSIEGQVLHVINVQQDESIKMLSERIKSSVSLEYTELINDINEQDKLTSQQKVKVIKKQQYQSTP